MPHFTQQKNGQSKTDKQKISSVTEEKATRAKVLLENFYTGLFTQYKERRDRHCKLEEALRIENMSDLAKLGLLHEERLLSKDKVRGGSSLAVAVMDQRF